MATEIKSENSGTGVVIGIVVALLIALAVYFFIARDNTTDTTVVPVATEETAPAVDTGVNATPSTETPAPEAPTGVNAPVNEVPAGTTDTMGTTGAAGSTDNRDTMGTSSDTTAE